MYLHLYVNVWRASFHHVIQNIKGAIGPPSARVDAVQCVRARYDLFQHLMQKN